MSRRTNVFGSFKYASDGIKAAVKYEPNFRIHLFVAYFVLLAAILLQVSVAEWSILIFTITFVLVTELINTAIEKLVDLVMPDYHEKAKIAKDVCAAAVLITAFAAIFIGVSIFLPKLISLFTNL